MKKTVEIFFLLWIIGFFFLSCSIFNPDKSVRYDGLYQAESSGDYWFYLRFYEDGTVLSASSSGTPSEVAEWFGKNKYTGKGIYTISRDHISFSVRSMRGTVDHDGTIENEKYLILDTYSHINGHKATKHFYFVETGF